MPTILEPGRRRRWIAAFALCVAGGLQLAAVPPELFAGSADVCVMACNVEGRDCCCTGSADEHTEPHAPEAEAHGRLTSFELPCRELCARFSPTSSGDLLPLTGARQAFGRPVEVAPLAPSSVSLRRYGHGDPSTLPRPPPSPARSLDAWKPV